MDTCLYDAKKGILTLPRRFVDDLFKDTRSALVVNDPKGWFISVYPIVDRSDLRRLTWTRAVAYAYGFDIDSNEADRSAAVLLNRISYRCELGGLGQEQNLQIPTDVQADVNTNNVNIRRCAQVIGVSTLDRGDFWVPTEYQRYYEKVRDKYDRPASQETIGFRSGSGERNTTETTTSPIPATQS